MKVKSQPSVVHFPRPADKKTLEVVGIGDAPYRADEKSTGSSLVFLASSENDSVAPYFGKVCHDMDTTRLTM